MKCEIPVVVSPLTVIDTLLKRFLDITLSIFFILALSVPILFIVLGVKWSSPGPIIFRQKRHGLNGKEIEVYKFRSMYIHSDDDVAQARTDDPRVTPFGAFLRRTSLDELPQFINVLQGNMSIVGPRPHAIVHNEYYAKYIDNYMLRHAVRPGMTGLAQVNGCRGETDTLDKMERRVQYDLEYIRNWSLWLDSKIIIKTIFIAFFDKNAY